MFNVLLFQPGDLFPLWSLIKAAETQVATHHTSIIHIH